MGGLFTNTTARTGFGGAGGKGSNGAPGAGGGGGPAIGILESFTATASYSGNTFAVGPGGPGGAPGSGAADSQSGADGLSVDFHKESAPEEL
jgi:hypothetical protein